MWFSLQKVLTSVNVKHLPDGGQKLRQQIADMTSQLGRLDIKIQHAQQEVAKQGKRPKNYKS